MTNKHHKSFKDILDFGGKKTAYMHRSIVFLIFCDKMMTLVFMKGNSR